MNPVFGDELVDQVGAIPDDIWINIFKYFAKEPVLFNLYNVNSQLTGVLDNYFHRKITIDFNKYIKLNNKIKIDEQVNYVMGYCYRIVSGIIIRDYYTTSETETHEIAIRNILDANVQALKLFHYERSPVLKRDITVEYIRDVMNRAINLVDVSITVCNSTGIIDLAALVNLHSLNISNNKRGRHRLRLPISSLTSLKLYQCNVLAATDLINVLTASRNTLVSLNLENVIASRKNITKDTMTSFVFPNLKYISVDKVMLRRVIDLKESVLLESIGLSVLEPNVFGYHSNLDVVGLDFRVHRFIKDVKSIVYRPELFQAIIQSIIGTKNESLECIEMEYALSFDYLLGTLAELGYERSKKLQIKLVNRTVPVDVTATFLSQFNIDFVGSL